MWRNILTAIRPIQPWWRNGVLYWIAWRSDPMQLYREIDWVMKLHLLTNYMERRGSGWDDPRIAMMDLQYHDIRPEKGFILRAGTQRSGPAYAHGRGYRAVYG